MKDPGYTNKKEDTFDQWMSCWQYDKENELPANTEETSSKRDNKTRIYFQYWLLLGEGVVSSQS